MSPRSHRALRTVSVGLLLAAAIHCGSSSSSTFGGSKTGPCETTYAGLCGGPCTSDASCPAGLYCGADATCHADCSAEHACSDSFQCSDRGRCSTFVLAPSFPDDGGALEDGATPDSVCADIDVALAKVLPKVLFLVDQSSSMHWFKFPSGSSNDCNPDCRWTVLKDVLIGPANNRGGLIKQLEGEAEIAFELYSATDPNPDDDDNSLLVGPTDPVCPRFNGKTFDGLSFSTAASANVEALLRNATVDDDTPTGPAVRKVVGLAEDGGVLDGSFAAAAGPAPKVLVLVTDGEPGLCGANSPSLEGRAAVVSAVEQTFTQKIKTFVIAIGQTTAEIEQHFNAVANVGQGLDPTTGDAGAIRPSTPKQLVDALRGIVLDARTCTFDLNGEVQPGMDRSGVVTLNGVTVPLADPPTSADGWRLLTPSRIELVGGTCVTLKATADARLSARFPCNAVKPRGPK